jgi:hypothetical protein
VSLFRCAWIQGVGFQGALGDLDRCRAGADSPLGEKSLGAVFGLAEALFRKMPARRSYAFSLNVSASILAPRRRGFGRGDSPLAPPVRFRVALSGFDLTRFRSSVQLMLVAGIVKGARLAP